METALRLHYKKPDLVLGDFFDVVGGTSTGAILAAGIAKGMNCADLQKIYLEEGSTIFTKALVGHIPFLNQVYATYLAKPLEGRLKHYLGENTTFADSALKCHLLVIAKCTTDGTTTFFSSHPTSTGYKFAKDVKLWEACRASSAAPTYFPPFRLESKKLDYIDGGCSLYNDPQNAMILSTTIPIYNIGYKMGCDKYLLVSVGTGIPATDSTNEKPSDNAVYWAKFLVDNFMNEAGRAQNFLANLVCYSPNVFNETTHLVEKNRVYADLSPEEKDALATKQLTRYRFNVDLTKERLTALFGGMLPVLLSKKGVIESLGELDNVSAANALNLIGKEIAKEQFDIGRFKGFL